MLLKPGVSGKSSQDASGLQRSRDDHGYGGHVDAWILFGDLDAALFQAGALTAWLTLLSAPRVLLGGGMSVLNAVFARGCDDLAFRIAWERVRAAHVLANAAIARLPLLGATRNGNGDALDIAGFLAGVRPSASAHTHVGLHLWLGEQLVDADGVKGQGLAGTIARSLHQRSSPQAFRAAIEAAVALGATRLLIPGIEERWITEHEIASAIEDARARRVEVALLPIVTRRPGIVGYVLPGLGRADRLWSDGRKAAMHWVASSSGANPATLSRAKAAATLDEQTD